MLEEEQKAEEQQKQSYMDFMKSKFSSTALRNEQEGSDPEKDIVMQQDVTADIENEVEETAKVQPVIPASSSAYVPDETHPAETEPVIQKPVV